MNPIFGFAAGYLGMNAFSWIYIDLGYSYELGIIPFYVFFYLKHNRLQFLRLGLNTQPECAGGKELQNGRGVVCVSI